MPAPDTIDPPSSDTMLALVAEQIGKMNGRASPGFDCVAASFIKNAVEVRPKPDGLGSERVTLSFHCSVVQSAMWQGLHSCVLEASEA